MHHGRTSSWSGHPARPLLQKIDDDWIWRPHSASEDRFRDEFVSYIRKLGLAGTYRDPEWSVRTLLSLYGFCLGKLKDALSAIGSQSAAELFVHTNSQWVEVTERHRRGELGEEDATYCDRFGSAARRATEIILEHLVLMEPDSRPACSQEERVAHVDYAMIAGEWMQEIAFMVPVIRDLHPKDSAIELDPDAEGDFLVHRLSDEIRMRVERYQAVLWAQSRDSTYARLISPDDLESMILDLNPAFIADHGIELEGMIEVIAHLRTSSRPRPEGTGFPIVFVNEERALHTVSKNAECNEALTNKAIAAFVLRSDMIRSEPHEPWQPKKARRVVRRPILSLPHDTGPHLCWSDRAVRAALEFVLQDLSFGRMPPEWDGPSVRARHQNYLQRVQRRWEDEITLELRTRGLFVAQRVKTIRGIEDERIKVAPGEIDCLCLDRTTGTIVLVEAKRIQPTYSPPEFVVDAQQFPEFVDALLRKLEWIQGNWSHVRVHLSRHEQFSNVPTVPSRVTGCMVTKYESYAQTLEQRVPIVSGSRLCQQFDEGGGWIWGECETV